MPIDKIVANARNKRDQRVEDSTARAVNALIDEIGGGVLPNDDAIYVQVEADFPVQDANTITLEENTPYILTGSFSTSKNIICMNGSSFGARNPQGHTLTFTGTGNFFSGTNASFRMYTVNVDAGITNQLYSFIDTTPLSSILVFDSVVVDNCAKWGTFEDVIIAETLNCSCGNALDGMSFVGQHRIVSIDKFALSSTDVGFTGLDFGSFTAQAFELSNILTVAPVGAVGISGLVDSGNVPVGSLASVTSSEFLGGMTPLENIDSSDIRWNFVGNTPIPDSRNAVDMYMINGSETITVSSSDTFYEIGLPSGGASWASEVSDRFTVSTDGVITYVGERPIDAKISGRATIEKTGGGADQLEVRIAKNWTFGEDGIYKTRAITENPTPTSVPIGGFVSLEQGDTIRVIFSNNDSTSNIIVDVTSMEVTG